MWSSVPGSALTVIKDRLNWMFLCLPQTLLPVPCLSHATLSFWNAVLLTSISIPVSILPSEISLDSAFKFSLAQERSEASNLQWHCFSNVLFALSLLPSYKTFVPQHTVLFRCQGRWCVSLCLLWPFGGLWVGRDLESTRVFPVACTAYFSISSKPHSFVSRILTKGAYYFMGGSNYD